MTTNSAPITEESEWQLADRESQKYFYTSPSEISELYFTYKSTVMTQHNCFWSGIIIVIYPFDFKSMLLYPVENRFHFSF